MVEYVLAAWQYVHPTGAKLDLIPVSMLLLALTCPSINYGTSFGLLIKFSDNRQSTRNIFREV